MTWSNSYDPTLGKDKEEWSPFEMILGRERVYTPDEVKNMTLCEQLNKGIHVLKTKTDERNSI